MKGMKWKLVSEKPVIQKAWGRKFVSCVWKKYKRGKEIKFICYSSPRYTKKFEKLL